MKQAPIHERESQGDRQVTLVHGSVWASQESSHYVAVVLFIGGLLASLLQGCAAQPHPPRLVCENCRIVCGACEEADRFVRLQGPSAGSRPDRSPTFSHPVTLHPEDWQVILSSLRVRRQGTPLLMFFLPKVLVSEAALTQEEVDYLSRTLSQAFAQAQPTEWVVFGLRRSGAPEVSEITTGGLFMEGAQLHVLLANYRYAVTAPTIQELVWENPLSSQINAYELVPGDHQALIQVEKQGMLRRAAPTELSIAYQPLLLNEPVSMSAPSNSSASSLLPHSPSEHRSYEERLHTLQRLRDQGVITEEEYRSKRSWLLERL